MPDYLPTAIPTARQLEYQDWEMGLFLHFGIRTFYEGHRDWDGKPMYPRDFLPSAFDAEQWVTTAKQAGATYMVLTAKHHSGFCLWPTHTTEHCVRNSSWLGGRGDGGRAGGLVCRRRPVPPAARPADSAHRHHPEQP